jgi:hypothetical protein
MGKNKAMKPPKMKIKKYDIGKEEPGSQFIVVVGLQYNKQVVQAWLSAMFRDEEGVVKSYYTINVRAPLEAAALVG